MFLEKNAPRYCNKPTAAALLSVGEFSVRFASKQASRDGYNARSAAPPRKATQRSGRPTMGPDAPETSSNSHRLPLLPASLFTSDLNFSRTFSTFGIATERTYGWFGLQDAKSWCFGSAG